MSLPTFDWLPTDAAGAPAVRQQVEAAIAAWSAAWIARRRVAISSYQTVTGVGRKGGAWRVFRTAVALDMSRQPSRLLDWTLDAQLEHGVLNDQDRAVVDAFERTLLEDLCARLENALGVPDSDAEARQPQNPLGPTGGVMLALADGAGVRLLEIAIPLSALLPAIRRALPAPRKGRRLDALEPALSHVRLRVPAQLGRARLTLREVEQIEIGDVLVLDARLDVGAALTGPPDDRPFAHGRLSDIEGRMALTLQP